MSISSLLKYFKNKKILFPLVLIVTNILLWYPALKFWFFLSWEQSYLMGMCGGKFNFICMMQSHGILYLINYKLFGWNPSGWYLTAIILFTTVVLLIYKLVNSITNHRLIAFITALLFSVNVAHNDVVNWGSFEGLYALIFTALLLGVLAYGEFRKALESKKILSIIIWYLLVFFFYSVGLFVREVALVFPFFILFYELLLNKFKFSIKYIKYLLKVFLPIAIFSYGYLLLRKKYGGSPNDLIDAMVQLRMALIAQHHYAEYIWRGLLSYGRFAASHLVPYPIMNSIKEFLVQFYNPYRVRYYFFSIAGFAYTFLLLGLIWYYRKFEKTRNILIFSFLWFLVPTVFYSFAFSITDYAILQSYGLDTTRWRYFAFFGTVLFWVTVFWQIYIDFSKKGRRMAQKTKSLILGLILLVLLVNFYLLRVVQHERYVTVYKPARDFYTSFFKNFKTLPKDYIFYLAQGSNPLGDYISEWYYTRQAYYPYLTEDRGREFGGGYLGMLLQRLKEGTANINSTFFLDYKGVGDLINRTGEAKKVIFEQKPYVYSVNKTINTVSVEQMGNSNKHQIDINLVPPLHVEIPYRYEIVITANQTSAYTLGNYPPAKEAALRTYARSRLDYLKNVKVSVCATAPAGSEGKPATHLVKEHLIDGNISSRSLWVADCRPAWIILDLGKVRRVGAVAFNAIDKGPSLPTDYTISVSNDKKNWADVLSIQQNSEAQKIHKLPRVVSTRYLRFTVNQTSEGGMATIAELEVLDETSLPVLEFYGDDFEKLIKESRNFGSVYMRFSWKTDPDNDPAGKELINKSTFIPITPDGFQHSYIVEPNEGEFYSSGGQFLKRFITSLHLDFVGIPANLKVFSVKVLPKFPISK